MNYEVIRTDTADSLIRKIILCVLRRQGYLVLILEKDLVFYKVDDNKKQVIVYAVVDQRQDYLCRQLFLHHTGQTRCSLNAVFKDLLHYLDL